MITTCTCVLAACDNCGIEFGNEDGAYYFPTQAHATVNVIEHGWVAQEDGRFVCDLCVAVAECAKTGHSTWRTIDTGTAIFRYCTRCHVRDTEAPR